MKKYLVFLGANDRVSIEAEFFDWDGNTADGTLSLRFAKKDGDKIVTVAWFSWPRICGFIESSAFKNVDRKSVV